MLIIYPKMNLYYFTCRRRDRPLNKANDRMCSCYFERRPTRNNSTTLGPTIFNGKRKATFQTEFPVPNKQQRRWLTKYSFIKILESVVNIGQCIAIGVIIIKKNYA